MEVSNEMNDKSKGANGNEIDEEGNATTTIQNPKKNILQDHNFISAAFLSFAEAAPNWVLWMLMTYFTVVWKESLTVSAAMVNLLEGCVAALSVFASFFAEAFPGQYLTALFSSITYATGLVLLWVTTTSKAPQKQDSLHKLFYFALSLVALGKAGASATFHPFASNQRTDTDTARGSSRRTWTTGAVATVSVALVIVGVFVLPFVKSWKVLFGVPALTMVYASFILVAFGYVFVKEEPSGSPLGSVPKVLIASTWRAIRPDSTSGNRRFLDKAITEGQEAQRSYLVCTDTEVKDTRALLKVGPIWPTLFAHGLVKSVGSTYFLVQATAMDRHVGKLAVPLPIFLLFFAGSVKIADALYASLRADPKPTHTKTSPKRRRISIPAAYIWVGAFFAVLSCVTAAAVERRRRGVARSHPDLPEGGVLPMSVFWLAPQYAFLGYAHGFSQRGVRGVFTDRVREELRGYSGVFVESANGVGVILSVLFVHVIKVVTGRSGREGWFGSSINESRLDYFYWTLAVVSAVNLGFFTMISYFYTDNAETEDGDEDLETPLP